MACQWDPKRHTIHCPGISIENCSLPPVYEKPKEIIRPLPYRAAVFRELRDILDYLDAFWAEVREIHRLRQDLKQKLDMLHDLKESGLQGGMLAQLISEGRVTMGSNPADDLVHLSTELESAEMGVEAIQKRLFQLNDEVNMQREEFYEIKEIVDWTT